MIKELIKVVPSEWLPLFRVGLIELKTPEVGPASAWTEWDKENRRFVVCVLRSFAEAITQPELAAVVEHEIDHIACGHFTIDCSGPDRLIAGDIEVNGWMQRAKTFAKLEQSVKRVFGKDAQVVEPGAWLTELELDPQQVYSAKIIHELIHTKLEAAIKEMGGNSWCGGVEATGDARAAAIGGATAAASKLGDGQVIGRAWGTGEGAGEFNYGSKPVPPWAEKLMEFARALVETGLGQGRKHSRPIHAFRQLNIHVPGRKPRWAPLPKQACILTDTSGSMWCGDILSYLAAAVSYMRANGIGIRFIAGDVRVTMDVVLSNGLPDALAGGGGTDIVPLFERAAKHEVDAVICVTDAEIPRWPGKQKFDTLWVVPTGVKPPFGQVAHYEER